MNLVLVEPDEIGTAGELTLSGARAAHLVNVLHVAPGHSVRVGLLDGPLGVGAVQSIGDNTVDLRCAFDAVVPSGLG